MKNGRGDLRRDGAGWGKREVELKSMTVTGVLLSSSGGRGKLNLKKGRQ